MKPWFTKFQLALLTVYVIVAVDVFGLTLIVPVIVTYARYLGASEASVGYLYAVYSGMALLATFFVGRLSDKYGRRSVFIYCCIGALASFVGSAFSQTFVQFAVCRGISGLFTGTIGNAYAYIGDLVPEKDKPRYISYVTATLSTCFVVGPIIGGGFAALDIRAPFVAAAAMAILELFLVCFYVHDTALPAEEVQDSTTPLLLHEHQPQAESQSNNDNSSSPVRDVASPALRRTDTRDSTDAMIGPDLSTLDAVAARPLPNPSGSGDVDASEELSSHTAAAASSEHTATTDTGEGGTDHDSGYEALDVPPWLNFGAMLIGGLGTFLSSMTYCGMAILIPFLLMDPDFGVVSGRDDDQRQDDDLSSHDSKKLSLLIGYLLTILGTIQVVGMLAVFPRVNKRLGLLFTGSLGALIYGGSFCSGRRGTPACTESSPPPSPPLWGTARSGPELYPIVVGMAVGYSLCRPVFPAFLSLVAHKDRRADYQSMSTCFIQLAWICAVGLTQFWALSHVGAILYSGAMSLLNSLVMLVYGVYMYRRRKKADTSGS
jgi:MFS family permease